MAGRHSHFPTFQKAIESAHRARLGGVAFWLLRSFRSERALLRLALYLLLTISVVHILAVRILYYESGLIPIMMMGRGFAGNLNTGSNGYLKPWAESVAFGTSFVLGPSMGELAFVLVALCLVGLVMTARVPVEVPRLQVEIPLFPTKFAPPELPPEQPTTPARHPIDPDPDDPPLVNPWPRRSISDS